MGLELLLFAGGRKFTRGSSTKDSGLLHREADAPPAHEDLDRPRVDVGGEGGRGGGGGGLQRGDLTKGS